MAFSRDNHFGLVLVTGAGDAKTAGNLTLYKVPSRDVTLHFVTAGTLRDIVSTLMEGEKETPSGAPTRHGSIERERKGSVSLGSGDSASGERGREEAEEMLEFLNSETRNKKKSEGAVRKSLLEAGFVAANEAAEE